MVTSDVLIVREGIREHNIHSACPPCLQLDPKGFFKADSDENASDGSRPILAFSHLP